MAYLLKGDLLEVCSCKVLCPCWVGEDPDFGSCDTVLAWKINEGVIKGLDVSGLTICILAHIPGNILGGNWRTVVYVDQKATPDQEQALLDLYTGKLGGPVTDVARLIGEIVAIERVPISAEVKEGAGRLKIGTEILADMEPFKGATGTVTTLNDSAFSTIPGSPAYVGKSSRFIAKRKDLGLDVSLQGHNAIQGTFHFQG